MNISIHDSQREAFSRYQGRGHLCYKTGGLQLYLGCSTVFRSGYTKQRNQTLSPSSTQAGGEDRQMIVHQDPENQVTALLWAQGREGTALIHLPARTLALMSE